MYVPRREAADRAARELAEGMLLARDVDASAKRLCGSVTRLADAVAECVAATTKSSKLTTGGGTRPRPLREKVRERSSGRTGGQITPGVTFALQT